MNVFLVTIALLLLSLSVPARAADDSLGERTDSNETENGSVDRRVWRGEPIRMLLKIDAERILRFPGATGVRAGLIGGPVPGLRIQPLDNQLYLTASQPFERTRLLVQTDKGQSVLLDLSAKADTVAGAGTLEILISGTQAPLPPPDALAVSDTPMRTNNRMRDNPVGYVALVRHAANTLYAPERLIPPDGRILRTPLHSQSPHLVRGAHIEATPLAAWRAAVRLRNLSPDRVDLDTRDLRGQWRASAFQHGYLGPAGREEDVTTAYLVSDRPFDEALGAIATAAAAGEAVP